jgi:hypothetical protein
VWSPEHDELRRMGVLLVMVAAVVGLAVLMLGRRASSQELPPEDLLHSALIAPELYDAEDRLQHAEAALRAERQRRMVKLMDLGLRAATHASPLRVARTAAKAAREVRDWNDRSSAEDRALDLLEAEVRSGQASPRAAELYTKLRERERAQQVERLEEQLSDAIDSQDAVAAQRCLARLRALAPERDWEEQAEQVSALSAQAAGQPRVEAVARWEPALAAALLSDHHAEVLRRAGPRSDERLAVAVALQHSGQHDEALALLKELAAGGDSVAVTARAWLADWRVHPEAGLDELWDRARLERSLGLLGGEQLAHDGAGLSRDAYSAWRRAFKPGNLVRGVPERLRDGWRPEARGFRDAAQLYLERFPDSAGAADARARLESLGDPPEGADAWSDGQLRLPRARTPHDKLRAAELLVHRDALDGAPLDGAPLQADGLVLWPAAPGSLDAVPAEMARALVYWLAGGLERGDLEDSRGEAGPMLAALQRLDAHLGRGGAIELVEWHRSAQPGSAQLVLALAAGDRVQTSAGQLWRRKDQLVLQRRLFGGNEECPEDWRCMRRRPDWNADLYARADTDGKFRLGARTSLAGVALGLELSRWGPSATLTLPMARWLGIEDRLPLETQLELELGGVSLTPELDPTREPTPLSR